MHELVIASGRIALEQGLSEGDIAIDAGRISVIGTGLKGRRTLDASGCWVLPGETITGRPATVLVRSQGRDGASRDTFPMHLEEHQPWRAI